MMQQFNKLLVKKTEGQRI